MSKRRASNQPRDTAADILARADELATRFESEDFDGDRLSPEEYERLRSRIRDDNVRP